MSLDFEHGSMLTVHRRTGPRVDKLGDALPAETTHTVGPCGIVDSHGTINTDDNGHAAWVGTVTVEAPKDSDVTVLDQITLPSGEKGVVIQPPVRPTNPFTGWVPFLTFVIATPGYQPQP